MKNRYHIMISLNIIIDIEKSIFNKKYRKKFDQNRNFISDKE